MCDFNSCSSVQIAAKLPQSFLFYLLANILALLKSAARKQRNGKHFGLIRSLGRMCKSAEAGIGYAQKGEAPASTRAWQDYTVLPTVLCTVLCDMVQGRSERKLKTWI